MSSEIEETASVLTYELACTDCAYETTVEGSVYDVLDVAKAHQEEYGEGYPGHFVDFEASDRTE